MGNDAPPADPGGLTIRIPEATLEAMLRRSDEGLGQEIRYMAEDMLARRAAPDG